MPAKATSVMINQGGVLPNGRYLGVWSGYFAKARIGIDVQLTLDRGVRGINVPCVITVKDGEVTVEAGTLATVPSEETFDGECDE